MLIATIVLPCSAASSVEAPRLRRRTREAVENVTVSTIVLRSSLFDESNRQLIRNELPALHYLSHFLRERGLRILQSTKDISGRYLRQMQTLLKQARLGTLSGTRRAHQYYDFRHTGLVCKLGSSSSQKRPPPGPRKPS